MRSRSTVYTRISAWVGDRKVIRRSHTNMKSPFDWKSELDKTCLDSYGYGYTIPYSYIEAAIDEESEIVHRSERQAELGWLRKSEL